MRKRTMTFGSGNVNNSSSVESVDVFYTDNREEVGFIEGEPKVKNAVATFSFVTDNKKDISTSTPADSEPKQLLTDTVPMLSKATGLRGLTPPIDGESFSVKRGYQFRPSTLRKLNELKTKHPDLDVYLNTILDAAILHYYNYIMSDDGKF